MNSTYHGNISFTIFGQSHSPAIGVTVEGLPAGFAPDMEALHRFMERRAPGRNDYSTPRKEDDLPEFLSGLQDGKLCGAPLTAIIRNNNSRSSLTVDALIAAGILSPSEGSKLARCRIAKP